MCSSQSVEKDLTAMVVKQLVELLTAAPKAISIEELGHVYTFKHAEPIKEVLKSAGCDLSLAGFLRAQKKFTVDGDNVVLAGPPGLNDVAPAAPPGVTVSRTDFLMRCPPGFRASGAVPAPPGLNSSALNMNFFFADDQCQLLKMEKQTRRSSPTRHSSPVRHSSAARHSSPARWKRESAPSPTPQDKEAKENYLSLHNKVSGRSFNSRVVQIMNEVQGIFERRMFLNVDRVVKGGSVSRGTAIHGCADAELVFCLKNVPKVSSGLWLPAVLRAVGSLVQSQLEEEPGQYFGCQDVRITTDCIKVQAGDISVDVRFVRAFHSHKEVIARIAEQDFEERRHTALALVQEKTLFVSKQPGQVKVTCRLLKWWRDQQDWTKPQARPSDDILELVSIYSGIKSRPVDQVAAMDKAMAALAHFDELRIVWSNFYGRGDVPAPLLKQRPLVMDPVNPFVNVADAQHFDPQELMAHARTSHFFY